MKSTGSTPPGRPPPLPFMILIWDSNIVSSLSCCYICCSLASTFDALWTPHFFFPCNNFQWSLHSCNWIPKLLWERCYSWNKWQCWICRGSNEKVRNTRWLCKQMSDGGDDDRWQFLTDFCFKPLKSFFFCVFVTENLFQFLGFQIFCRGTVPVAPKSVSMNQSDYLWVL